MNWKAKIDVVAEFKAFNQLSIEEQEEQFISSRDKIVVKLKHAREELQKKINYLSLYDDCVGALSTAEDLDAFNNYWNDLYNWADANAVWIATF